MMNSPHSSSETESDSFHQLDPRIQRWIWERNWTALKEAQERAIPRLIHPKGDVVRAPAHDGQDSGVMADTLPGA